MNSRKITKYVILVFTILLADIIKEIVLHLIGIERNHHKPYLSAAVGMGIIVLVFYPMFTIMEKVLESFTVSYVKGTKSVTGGGSKGLVVAFVVGIAVLYFAYLKVWFGINIFAKMF